MTKRWWLGREGRGGGGQPRERGEKKKSLVSENTILQSMRLLPTGADEEKSGSAVSCLEKKRTFCEAERVGSPSSLGPRDPTSTSSLAERNMQTHFIDFWGFAEKPDWSFAGRASRPRDRRERDRGRERDTLFMRGRGGGAKQ